MIDEKHIFKLFIIEDKPYLTKDEDVSVGDLAIVSVGDLYGSVVLCVNDEQIDRFQKSKLSMTKRHKVIFKPEKINLDLDTLNTIKEMNNCVTVEYINGIINIL